MADDTRIEVLPSRGSIWYAEDGLDDEVVVWTVTGTVDSVAEIGEILAWIVAALSLSRFPSGICASCPALSSPPIRPGIDNFAHCKISPYLSDIEDPRSANSGNCWTNILGNTVYVRGYPTARRVEHHTGMEVSLATMISLVRSRRLSRFKGRFCIKGYCSIIMPTRRQGDCIYWHLVTDHSGEHIHFTDYRVQRLWGEYPQNLNITALEKSRHILGWCDNIQNFAGTYDPSMPSFSIQISYVLFLYSFFEVYSAVATIPD